MKRRNELREVLAALVLELAMVALVTGVAMVVLLLRKDIEEVQSLQLEFEYQINSFSFFLFFFFFFFVANQLSDEDSDDDPMSEEEESDEEGLTVAEKAKRRAAKQIVAKGPAKEKEDKEEAEEGEEEKEEQKTEEKKEEKEEEKELPPLGGADARCNEGAADSQGLGNESAGTQELAGNDIEGRRRRTRKPKNMYMLVGMSPL